MSCPLKSNHNYHLPKHDREDLMFSRGFTKADMWKSMATAKLARSKENNVIRDIVNKGWSAPVVKNGFVEYTPVGSDVFGPLLVNAPARYRHFDLRGSPTAFKHLKWKTPEYMTTPEWGHYLEEYKMFGGNARCGTCAPAFYGDPNKLLYEAAKFDHIKPMKITPLKRMSLAWNRMFENVKKYY